MSAPDRPARGEVFAEPHKAAALLLAAAVVDRTLRAAAEQVQDALIAQDAELCTLRAQQSAALALAVEWEREAIARQPDTLMGHEIHEMNGEQSTCRAHAAELREALAGRGCPAAPWPAAPDGASEIATWDSGNVWLVRASETFAGDAVLCGASLVGGQMCIRAVSEDLRCPRHGQRKARPEAPDVGTTGGDA